MFGSLVVVFPTPHEGGALLLQKRDYEWTSAPDGFGQDLATEEGPSIGYMAFLSDVEQEVAPVTSGHCITLTYGLYFGDSEPVSVKGAVSEHLTPPLLAKEDKFHEVFKTLLENPEFLADGGTLAFGLRHVYPIKNNLKHVSSVLKGSDAIMYQNVRALGYEPVLYVYYWDENNGQGLIIDEIVGFPYGHCGEQDLISILHENGGILVTQEGREPVMERHPRLVEYGTQEQVEWVTPLTNSNPLEDEFISYGNEASVEWAYGDICLVVRIGKAGDRLAYPRVAELKKARKAEERGQRFGLIGY
jgi:hypothetical protein